MIIEKDIVAFSQSPLRRYTDNLSVRNVLSDDAWKFDLQLFGKGGGKSVGKLIVSIGIGLLAAGVLGPGAWAAGGGVNWSVGIAVGSLVSSVWTAIAGQKMSDFDSGSPEVNRFDKAQETMSSDGYIPVVYGERKITGNQVFHETDADQNTLHKHVILCEGGVEGLVSVTANDLLVPTGTQTSNTVFTIQNTKHEDASCKKIGKTLYLYANGKEKTLYLVNADDSQKLETFWSWQTSISGLITYINSLGEGWQAFPTAITSKYPGNLNDFYDLNRQYLDSDTVSEWWGSRFYYNGTRYDADSSNAGKNFVANGYYFECVGQRNESDSDGGYYTYYFYKRYTNDRNYYTCYKSPVNVTAATVTGGTNYTFHDSDTPQNYMNTGGYTDCAWLDATFISSSELNGNPNLDCIIKGKKVYDSRTGKTEYSTNPAMCLRDFLLSDRYGLGKWFSSDDIDDDSWNEAANYCDEVITFRNADGSFEEAKRYELNMVIDAEQSALHWLQEILANFCGYIVYSDGKLKLKIEKQTDVSYHFNDSNTRDIKITPLALGETPNRYKVNIIDPLSNWAAVACLCEDFADQKERQKIVTKEVQLNGCTSQHQALRLARFYRDYNLTCPLVIGFTTGMQAMHLEPGDVVTVSYHQVFKDLPIRISEIKETEKGEFEITGRQYNDSIYNDELGGTIQIKQYSTMPTPYVGDLPTVYNLSVVEDGALGQDGSYMGVVDCSWDVPNYPFNRRYEVYYSYDLENWTYAGDPPDNKFRLTNTDSDKKIYVKVRMVNTADRKSVFCEPVELYLLGKNLPPDDVPWLTLSQFYTNIIAEISEVDDVDLSHYLIKLGSSWNTGTEVGTFTGNRYMFPATTNGTCTYWVKAVDDSGNESRHAVKCVINVNDLPERNIVFDRTYYPKDTTYDLMYEWRETLRNKSTLTYAQMTYFKEMFEQLVYFDGTIYLPLIDLGDSLMDNDTFWLDKEGVMHRQNKIRLKDMELFSDIFAHKYEYEKLTTLASTFVNIKIDGRDDEKKDDIVYDIYYRTSIDGITFTDWTSAMQAEFTGRYIQLKIVTSSKSTHTQDIIKSIHVYIDVPDKEISLENIKVPAHPITVDYGHRFAELPSSVVCWARDNNNVSCTYVIESYDKRTFTVAILDDNGDYMEGKIVRALIRGY